MADFRTLIDLVESANAGALIESASTLALVFQTVDDAGVVTDNIRELEEIWAGGIADFGDKRAAYAIKRLPGYDAYREALVQALRQHIGFPLVVYRLTTAQAYEDWTLDGNSEDIAVAVDARTAESFLKFAGHDRMDRVLVEMTVADHEAVIMRGKLTENEIVLDAGWVQPSDTRIVKAFGGK